jgi:hypothetical protein
MGRADGGRCRGVDVTLLVAIVERGDLVFVPFTGLLILAVERCWRAGEKLRGKR